MTCNTGAICGGVGKRYQARVRLRGYRRYELVGKPTKSYRVAVRRMAAAFVEHRYQRGDVLMWADYYDPVQLCELVNHD
ncbi:hypothetical protein LCGC14_1167770 [marine sediment metagenome]|uniref:Uncharacterized protein n=1 Tax=marine sediment metagenome TaxID=412755 RepID=A0A0F9LVL3_9ZZZZ